LTRNSEIRATIAVGVSKYKSLFKAMSPSLLTLEAPKSTTSNHLEAATSEHRQQVAKLTRASYPVDKQAKFLELQAEVETLFIQLQALQRVRV
jgi:hypothetical protein